MHTYTSQKLLKILFAVQQPATVQYSNSLNYNVRGYILNYVM